MTFVVTLPWQSAASKPGFAEHRVIIPESYGFAILPSCFPYHKKHCIEWACYPHPVIKHAQFIQKATVAAGQTWSNTQQWG
jgi:hypothetical protein